MNALDVIAGVELKPTDKILIVGGRVSNFPQEIRFHPQLIFWHSTDPDILRKEKIPEAVRLILFTRFVAHKLSNRIRSITPEGVKIVSHVQTTGVIKNILKSLGILAEVEEAQEEVEERTKRFVETFKARLEPAVLDKFVSANANFDAEKVQEEIRRLFGQAESAGLPATEQSIRECFYRLRAELKREAFMLRSAPPPERAVPKDAEEAEAYLKEFIQRLRPLTEEAQAAAVALDYILADRERLLKLEKEIQVFKEMMRQLLKTEKDRS